MRRSHWNWLMSKMGSVDEIGNIFPDAIDFITDRIN